MKAPWWPIAEAVQIAVRISPCTQEWLYGTRRYIDCQVSNTIPYNVP